MRTGPSVALTGRGIATRSRGSARSQDFIDYVHSYDEVGAAPYEGEDVAKDGHWECLKSFSCRATPVI